MTQSSSVPSSPVVSASYSPRPVDRRCRFWAKVIRAGSPIPLPENVHGANDVPGPYLRTGDDIELFPGDFVLTGEENRHAKRRGWSYNLLALGRAGSVRGVYSYPYGADTKAELRKAGRKDLLLGSGDVAAMIREIHARRGGIRPMPRIAPRPSVKDTAESDASRSDPVATELAEVQS